MIDRIQRVHVYSNKDPEQHTSCQTLIGVQGHIKDSIFVVVPANVYNVVDTIVVTTEGDFAPDEILTIVNNDNPEKSIVFIKDISIDSTPKVHIYKKQT